MERQRDVVAVNAHNGAPPHTNGSAPWGQEWVRPRTRQDVDEAILALSNDIGLILAQLAEDQPSWCGRTGRTPSDYAAWRRRALFAKVHKEGQLRECKRIRTQLTSVQHEPEAERSQGRAIAILIARCHCVLDAWLAQGARLGVIRVDQSLRELAEALDDIDAGQAHIDTDVGLLGSSLRASRLGVATNTIMSSED
jgi:hypothetical protein